MGKIYRCVAAIKDASTVISFVTETAVTMGADREATEDLSLALYEAIVNIITHGYQKQPGFLELEVEKKNSDLLVYLRDQAPHYNPTDNPSPNTFYSLEERPLGGMGVHMMHNFADDVKYHVNNLMQNELILIKKDAFVVPANRLVEFRNKEEILKLGLFQDSSTHHFYQPDEVIFEQGDRGDAMYVLLTGEVRVLIEGRQIDRLYPGSMLGEMALIDARVRSADAVAATACKMAYIDRRRFTELTRQHPEFAIELIQIMSMRVRGFLAEEIERQRMEEELAIGQQIQMSLLPKACPIIPGWEFAARYRAARKVGGDLYDFIQHPDHPELVQLVVADVTGKGVPAAMFMALARTFVRAESAHSHEPATILRRTNRHLVKDAQARLFLSMFYGSLNVNNGRLTFANGGHDWPFLYKSKTNSVIQLQTNGFPLGPFDEIEPIAQEIDLESGDFLLLYTDGVTESRNSAGDMFDDEGLEKIILNSTAETAQELLDEIDTAVSIFLGSEPASDDLTLVVIKRQ